MHKTDANTPLHLLEPEYEIPYRIPSRNEILNDLKRILSFLEKVTPAERINKTNNQKLDNKSQIDENTEFAEGDFRLTSYEWGVTYAGMLLAGSVSGETLFTNYAKKRLQLITDLSSYHLKNKISQHDKKSSIYTVVNPLALDDAGALCAAMIKAELAGLNLVLRPQINNFVHYISKKEFRFKDGTFARNRPYPNTLWLDDLFMSVPALAQMGTLTGDFTYFDDAVKQVVQFSERMFIPQKGIYMHGWVQQMKDRNTFCWGRANGWALMAMVELLSVLPKTHSGYQDVLNQFKLHVKGLARLQSGNGFWHQLVDRNDSYPETSATAIITYSFARAINLGLIDKYAFAPITVLGWNAVASKINENGQVEGTCVGTGMGFDAAFYYHRPVNVFAAHGYGPALLAGAEMIRLIETHTFEMNENALLLKS